MYIPSHFSSSDLQGAIHFMRRYSFGTLVGVHDGKPEANHLPFVVDGGLGNLRISSHMAKANPQSGRLESQELMILFSEPHAYISPRHYEKEQSVPTWNYMAVHVYGRAAIVEDELAKLDLLEKMILTFEADYMNQWLGLPDEFKHRMMKGITAFEFRITDIQTKNKLSQNRSEGEWKNIIAELTKSSDTGEQQLAEYMKTLTN